MNIANNNLIIILILVQLLQSLILIQYLYYYDLLKGPLEVLEVNFFLVFNVFLALCYLKKLYLTDLQAQEIKMQNDNLIGIESLLKNIRKQKHDYLNHLHSLYGVIQSGKFEAAKKYFEDVASEARANSDLLNLKFPEVSALLQRKIIQAATQNTIIDLEIRIDLADIPVKPYLLNKVFGNLIDNALEAVGVCETESREIILSIDKAGCCYRIVISDSGPEPLPDVLEKMFEYGFSTKGSDRGLGLSITKDIIESCSGSIEFKVRPSTFTIMLPVRQEKGHIDNL